MAMSGRADDVLVVCPLTVEAVSVWWGLRGGDVVRAGMRARRRSAVLAALRQRPEVPVVVAGVACALTSATRPGDLVVPDVVCSPRGTWECATAPLLTSVLRGNGHTVHRGALVESDRVVWRVRRGTAAVEDDVRESGDPVALDLESALLVELIEQERPAAVLRAVVDTPTRPLASPATIPGGAAALAALAASGPALRAWATVVARRTWTNDSVVKEVRHRWVCRGTRVCASRAT